MCIRLTVVRPEVTHQVTMGSVGTIDVSSQGGGERLPDPPGKKLSPLRFTKDLVSFGPRW